MGFEITSSHHEIAPAQHEIDFRYDEALVTADNLMTFKMVVKTIAKRHGLHATFMPKPKIETYGSGMHINLSLSRDGVNAFQSETDPNGLSREGYYFIGGLMKHMKAITCITNPTVNSYKRFVPGYERAGLHGLVFKDERTADPCAFRKRGEHQDRTAKPGCNGKPRILRWQCFSWQDWMVSSIKLCLRSVSTKIFRK